MNTVIKINLSMILEKNLNRINYNNIKRIFYKFSKIDINYDFK